MTGVGRRFGFTADGRRVELDREPLSDADFHDREARLDQGMALAGPAEPWARDLLQVARAVYLVDKRYDRRTEDGWSRTVDLSVEVAEPERWGPAQLADLSTLLATLTSDTWHVRVAGGAAYRQWLDYEERASEVALFSGGLDSTSYAAQAAVRAHAGTLLLMGYDDNIRARQQEVRRCLDRIRNRPIKLVQIGQRVLSGPGKLERSTRTRGLLYLATAVAAASAHRVGQVKAPENGQLAINPPLTPNRLAGLSTRSVHPWTLELTNRLIRGLGGAVEVVNPLLSCTKGEVCGQALDAGLSPEDLARTVSCGDPSSARYSHQGQFNCGHCYPCLVRRSGLLAAVGIDGTDYRLDLARTDMRTRVAQHLRALARWLATDFGFRDLVADMPFPSSTPIPAVLPMLHRGRRELAAMVEQVVPESSPLRRNWNPRVAG
ncbi:7-cyano-7-deazaguanine synthase [Amycolatopsis sp. YIM 10]|uniref:7-cyano-7-deazaguanine synthase n=1 Tax=Amycolatopsis sp. YIM 10 TaxID=2653857 RepID=UPI0012904B3A|nr:7-cyano-7-deazaguanine synthase [Amycolatopsis sp. YIM 10]QFU88953.1 7-cyano-7-deazaguanine synthase [Amycolatopsis sp. YIM 10]